MARQGRFLFRRQLAWPVAAPRVGADFPGATMPDQRLVDVRHADPEHRGCRPRRHAAINRPPKPRPQVLRIALTLPPSHHRPQHVAWAADHTFSRAGIAFDDSANAAMLEIEARCDGPGCADAKMFTNAIWSTSPPQPWHPDAAGWVRNPQRGGCTDAPLPAAPS